MQLETSCYWTACWTGFRVLEEKNWFLCAIRKLDKTRSL